jgi:hypothetical protein
LSQSLPEAGSVCDAGTERNAAWRFVSRKLSAQQPQAVTKSGAVIAKGKGNCPVLGTEDAKDTRLELVESKIEEKRIVV